MIYNATGNWRAGSTDSTRATELGTGSPRSGWSFVTWPTVAFLGASVAASLLGECDWGAPIEAKKTLTGHTGTLKTIQFRPDGAMLSSVGFDGSIKIWKLANGLRVPVRAPRA